MQVGKFSPADRRNFFFNESFLSMNLVNFIQFNFKEENKQYFNTFSTEKFPVIAIEITE